MATSITLITILSALSLGNANFFDRGSLDTPLAPTAMDSMMDSMPPMMDITAGQTISKGQNQRRRLQAEDNPCDDAFNGQGWTLVRHSHDVWPQATDNLLGTAVYGDSSDGPLSDNQFSVKFNDLVSDDTQFLFSNGDCTRWLVTTFDQFNTQFGSNVERQILRSSISSTPYTAKWYNRPGVVEDPWISVGDHHDSVAMDKLVYSEASNGYHTDSVQGQYLNVWTKSGEETVMPSLDSCEKGVNYAFDGVPCSISGDPHYTTWAGARHDFQGSANGQYYYLSQCAGSSTVDMPYSFIGKHTPWRGTVQGLDHFTIALYGETDYYIFISANLHHYIEVEYASGSSYDDNSANANLIAMDSEDDTQIGNFTFHFTQSSISRIDAVLTTGDGCTVRFYMQGQIWGDQNRYMMHSAVIQPPSCHRCHACGICGDFKSSGSQLQTCYGSAISFSSGWGATNAFAYDANGNTWEQQYRDTHCVVSDGIETTEAPGGPPDEYVPEIPEDFPFEDLCDEAIVDEVASQCEDAMEDVSECCDVIGGGVCDELLEDCKYDACVAAEGDADEIAVAVSALFTDAVEMVCDIPDIGDGFDDDNLDEDPMPPTTDYPTQDPTTSEPTTALPTSDPTRNPTTSEPTTESPTSDPTRNPTTSEPTTESPTSDPTRNPTTSEPTAYPTTADPTRDPTVSPTTDLYLRVDEHLSRDDADARCLELYGTHLASIHSQSENDEAYELCGQGQTADSELRWCWIGVYFDPETQTIGWTDGSPVEFANWRAGTPNGGAGYNYIKSKWEDGTADSRWKDGTEDYYTAVDRFLCNAPGRTSTPSPTTKTLIEGHMIIDGDGIYSEQGGEVKFAECALDTATDGSFSNNYGSKIAVQCCSADGTTGYRWMGETLGCVSGVTYAEAEQICVNAGYRLCTQEETLTKVNDGLGCDFDFYHAWTSTPCFLPTEETSFPEVVDMGQPEYGCGCLEQCEGDCDTDLDCVGDLLCWHREAWIDPVPPGCSGNPHSKSYDYCFDPMAICQASEDGEVEPSFVEGTAANKNVIVDLSSFSSGNAWVASLLVLLLALAMYVAYQKCFSSKRTAYAKVQIDDVEIITDEEQALNA